MHDSTNPVALVTGAGRGIGREVAAQLAGSGYDVILSARDPDAAGRAATEAAAQTGARVSALTLDVSDPASISVAAERLTQDPGRLDVLVNNAGLMLLGPVAGADVSEWRRMVEVNLLGLLYCTHAALPIMGEQGSGHIVNVSSVAGRTANLGSAVYNLTKWGVNGFSEGLRQEVLHAGVRVTIIEPGFVETELQGHNENPQVKDAIGEMREQIGKPLEASDIAGAILNAVSQPEHVSINEVLIRPTRQQR